MAADGKRRKPEQAGYRIWPGVTVIAFCTFLLFVLVYAIAYNSALIPLPDYIEALLQKNAETELFEGGESEDLSGLYPGAEKGKPEVFNPAAQEPQELLRALEMPAQYYQKMQITYRADGAQKNCTVELYRMDAFWKLCMQEKKSGQTHQYISDGEQILRTGSEWLLDDTQMSAGQFTPENLIGMPSLQEIKELENMAVICESDAKHLQFSGQTPTGIQCSGRIALDTGLVIELQLKQEDNIFFSMYTVLFDLSPAEFRQADFFTLTENGGNNQ